MGYTKYDYQIIKLDRRPYWPKAEKPMAIVSKEWEKAILVSRMWHSERMRKAYFPYHDDVAKQVRPTIVMNKKMRGATFASAQEWEGLPVSSNEDDLKALEREAKKRYNEATIENTASRIKMMLGMLGDVKEISTSSIDLWRMSSKAHDFKVFEVKGQTLVLLGGDA